MKKVFSRIWKSILHVSFFVVIFGCLFLVVGAVYFIATSHSTVDLTDLILLSFGAAGLGMLATYGIHSGKSDDNK